DGSIDPSTIDIVKTPDNGTYSVSSNGVITYTPNAGFVGGDTIRYRVQDDRGVYSNVATVTFRVGPVHSLSGKVFVDLNGDGIQNGNDVPLGGVLVYLDKTDGAYTYRDVYVTEADGSYVFTDLVTGMY